MSALTRITAVILRAIADELEPPKPAQAAAQAPGRDPASTTASSTQIAAPRASSRQGRRVNPVGFGRDPGT